MRSWNTPSAGRQGWRNRTGQRTDDFVASHPGTHLGYGESPGHTAPVHRTRYRKLSPLSLPKYLGEADFERNAIHELDFIQWCLNALWGIPSKGISP